MNRDRQIKKDIENKHAQARDEYAKNKPLYSENKINEKINDFIPHDTTKTNELNDEKENNKEQK